jgi:hypothetical protein
MELAKERNMRFILPCDVRVSRSLARAEDLRVTVLTVSCCTSENPCIPDGTLLPLLAFLCHQVKDGRQAFATYFAYARDALLKQCDGCLLELLIMVSSGRDT